MVIVFSTKGTEKELGKTLYKSCKHCNNVCWYDLTKITRWFSLFFVSLVPYQKRYFFTCELCGWGFEVKGDCLDTLKRINGKAKAWEAGEISESEYKAYVDMQCF